MVHKVLRLQHHRHTARKLEHEHTSYRALAVVLLATALCISLIQRASAGTFTVDAIVPGSTLTSPAVITSPADNTTVNTSTATVQGTCQVVIQGTVVTLERDGAVIGSQACGSNSRFSITVTLLEGPNTITPKVSDTASVAGPDGTPVRITYTIPPSPPLVAPGPGDSGGQSTGSSSGGPSGTKTPAKAVTITSPDAFVTYDTSRRINLKSVVAGGVGPYDITIDWGDGSKNTGLKLAKEGNFTYLHTYQLGGVYVIRMTVTDSKGEMYLLELAAVGLEVPVPLLAGPIDSGNPPLTFGTFASAEARVVWALYGALVLATIGMWILAPTHLAVAHVPVVTKLLPPRRRL